MTLSTGWDLRYFYLGDPKSHWQIGVKGLVAPLIKEITPPELGSELTIRRLLFYAESTETSWVLTSSPIIRDIHITDIEE